MLKRRFALALATAAPALGASVPASAQWWFDGPPGPHVYEMRPGYPYPGPYGYGYRWGPGPAYARPLPPDAIVERLEDADYERVSRPLFNGSTYTVDATAPNGRRVRLVLDAYRGVILGGRRPGEAVAGPVPEMQPVPEMGAREPRPAPRRREAARGDAGLNPGRLPAPADPRVAPKPDEDGAEAAAPEARPKVRPKREAVRSEPAGKASGSAARPGADPKPAATPKVPAPPPVGATRETPRAPAEAKADPARSERPVRVIQGVTPVPGGAAAPGSQLDNLPAPPAVTPPTGTE